MPIVAKLARGRRQRRGPRRLKSVRTIPALLTLSNLVCGFAAIHFGLQGMYDYGAGVPSSDVITGHSALLERMLPSLISVGAGLIILGMVFDSVDGLVARMTRSTTDFGGQLDSLADVVTCGVAPAILMIAYMHQELKSLDMSLSPLSADTMGRAVWVSAAVYVACAAVRLARFNVEHATAEYDPATFRGLPSPGAASMIVTALICLEQAREYGIAVPGGMRVHAIPATTVVYLMPVLALGSGLLMVSRVRYRKLSAMLQGKRPFGQLILMILLFAIFWPFKAFFLTLLVVVYGVSGPAEFIVRRLHARRSADAGATAAATPVDADTHKTA
ncbi:MAG: CDP-alcohol phosphatidyltransferase family protein [Phycisphaerae bacterium]